MFINSKAVTLCPSVCPLLLKRAPAEETKPHTQCHWLKTATFAQIPPTVQQYYREELNKWCWLSVSSLDKPFNDHIEASLLLIYQSCKASNWKKLKESPNPICMLLFVSYYWDNNLAFCILCTHYYLSLSLIDLFLLHSLLYHFSKLLYMKHCLLYLFMLYPTDINIKCCIKKMNDRTQTCLWLAYRPKSIAYSLLHTSVLLYLKKPQCIAEYMYMSFEQAWLQRSLLLSVIVFHSP